MADNKTKPNDVNVEDFLKGIEDPGKREDCKAISLIMEELTGSRPKMWGNSIVGFGEYHYRYASGREGDWFLVGFAPRKQNLALYVMGYLEIYADILVNLGKHKHGKGCLYIKRLKDIDVEVLKNLLKTSIERLENHQ